MSEQPIELIDPDKYDLFYKYVRRRTTGEATGKLFVGQAAAAWVSVKAVMNEHYATKRTLDFYACAMYNVRQAAWCSRLDQFQILGKQLLKARPHLKCVVPQNWFPS
jgi:hypothetical protein